MFFSVNSMQKDMLLALEMGRSLNVPLPTTATTEEYLVAAKALGMGEREFSSISGFSRRCPVLRPDGICQLA